MIPSFPFASQLNSILEEIPDIFFFNSPEQYYPKGASVTLQARAECAKGSILGFRYKAFRTNQQQDCIDFGTEWPPPNGIDTSYNFGGKSITHSSSV